MDNSVKDPQAAALLAELEQMAEHTTALQKLWLLNLISQEAPNQRQFRIWLREYGFDNLKSALDATAVWLNKQKDEDPDNIAQERKERYVAGVLRGAELDKMTPEERQAKISDIRAAAGRLGGRAKHRKEKAAAQAEILKAMAESRKEVLPDFARVSPTLPDICLSGSNGSSCSNGYGEGSGSSTTDCQVGEKGELPTSNLSTCNLEPKPEPTPTATATPSSRDSVPNPDGGCLPPVPPRGLSSPAAKGKSRRRACKHKQGFPESFDSWSAVAKSTWCADGHPKEEGGLSVLQQYDKDKRRAAVIPAPPTEPVQEGPPPPTLCPGCAELMKNCTCDDDLRGDPCAYCGLRYLPQSMPLHLNGKCPTKKRLDREAAAKAAGV